MECERTLEKKKKNASLKEILVNINADNIRKINVCKRLICGENTNWLKQICHKAFNAKLCYNFFIIWFT